MVFDMSQLCSRSDGSRCSCQVLTPTELQSLLTSLPAAKIDGRGLWDAQIPIGMPREKELDLDKSAW